MLVQLISTGRRGSLICTYTFEWPHLILKHNYSIWYIGSRLSMVQCQTGEKSLPEPMLTCCQFSSQDQTCVISVSLYRNFHWRKHRNEMKLHKLSSWSFHPHIVYTAVLLRIIYISQWHFITLFSRLFGQRLNQPNNKDVIKLVNTWTV